MNLDIVIITYQRPQLLSKCLSSIYDSVVNMSSAQQFSVHVYFNGDESGFYNFENQFDMNVVKYLLEEVSPACARNRAAKVLGGDYILFLDDDIVLSKTYLSVLFKQLEEQKYDVLGGFDCASSESNFLERVINYALESPLVTATTRYRHIYKKVCSTIDERHLTLSNLCISNKVFAHGLLFDSSYFRNEENIFIQQAIGLGYRVSRSDELFVSHRRRNRIDNFFIPSFWSGVYRLRSMIEYPNLFSYVYLIPLLFLVYTFAILGGQYWHGTVLNILYLFLIAISAIIRGIVEGDIKIIIPLFLVQLILVISYSCGQLYSLFCYTLNYRKRRARLWNE